MIVLLYSLADRFQDVIDQTQLRSRFRNTNSFLFSFLIAPVMFSSSKTYSKQALRPDTAVALFVLVNISGDNRTVFRRIRTHEHRYA